MVLPVPELLLLFTSTPGNKSTNMYRITWVWGGDAFHNAKDKLCLSYTGGVRWTGVCVSKKKYGTDKRKYKHVTIPLSLLAENIQFNASFS